MRTMRKKAKEIFTKKSRPCPAALEATKRLRRRVRKKGQRSRSKKDDGKPFIQRSLNAKKGD